MRPKPGDLLRIDGRASVQFAGDRALTFRVVSVPDRQTYPGWVWLTGYVLNRRGEATAKREIYVQLAGLRRAASAGAPGRSRIVRSRPGSGTQAKQLATAQPTARVGP
ncbi:hypothetical protein [Micromonospora costi]|uniref:hypothetical protein n=1 Tax=Micromonospora costi TaxID=1530042 RepID=UPI001F4EECC4|nr:hypothetical protein [Micromonospora costi]